MGESHLRLPSNDLFSLGDVRATLLRVIGESRHVANLGRLVYLFDNEFGKLLDGVLDGVSNVDGESVVGFHELNEPVDEVVDVLEGAGLAPITVNCNVLAFKGLDDEVGDDTSVMLIHTRTVSVEDTCHANIDIVPLGVRVGEGLCDTLSFVIASTGPNLYLN